jgi:hypothetical protein
MKTGKRIPITAAKQIADTYGYTQVIIHAYDGEQSGVQCVATYGKTVDDCNNAANGGNHIKKLLGWSPHLCNTLPRRRKKEEVDNSLDKPETLMKQGFESLSATRSYFKNAVVEYQKRNSSAKADPENAKNVQEAINLLNKAYDEISAIWENDIMDS